MNQTPTTTNTPITDLTKLNFLQAILYDKADLLKVFLLIVYTILLILVYVKNPYELVTEHTNIMLVITAVSSFYMYYMNVKTNEKVINFKYDIFKYVILLVCFIATISFLYIFNPAGYITSTYSLPIIIILMSASIFIISSLFLYITLASFTKNTSINSAAIIKSDQAIYLTILKYFLLGSFGTFVSILFVQYIVGLIANASSASGIVKLIVNLCIVLVLLALLFRLLSSTNFYKESPLVQLILNSIFFIPCLFILSADKIATAIPGQKKSELLNIKPSDYILLAIAVTLNVAYYVYPYIANFYAKQGGLLLVNMPVYTDAEYNLGSYIDLNGTDTFDYTYALSFWLYIDAASPSVSASSSKYVSVLNYGNKPNVLYNVVENSMRITMSNPYSSNDYTDNHFNLDENGDVIIYTMKDVLLQKWNNIIINYNGGTLDIFYNGELVKSFPQIVPYMNYDSLTIGQPAGVKGGICNVNYFKQSVSMSQIYHIYNYAKDKTPPVYTNNDETIIHIVKEST